MTTSSAAASGVSTYRVGQVAVLSVAGAALVLVGLLVVVAALLGFPGWSVVMLAVVGGAWLVLVIALLLRRPVLLTLSPTSYRVHGVRGHQPNSRSWDEVTTVENVRVAGFPAVVVALADGSTSYVPISLLGAASMAAQRDMHERLNAAYGYRKLDT